MSIYTVIKDNIATADILRTNIGFKNFHILESFVCVDEPLIRVFQDFNQVID